MVTIDTGANVTVARPDIAAGWPERQTKKSYTLQTVSGEALDVIKEVCLTLTLGRRPLKIWVFVADITNEFILGLDILRAYDASVDIGRQTLRLADEEVSVWSPGAGPRSSSLIVEEDQIIPAQCEGTVMARLERPIGVENGLVERSPQDRSIEGIYICRTLVKNCARVPVRVLNATYRDHKLTKGSSLGKCEPVTLVTTPDLDQPKAKESRSKLQDITEAAKPNLSDEEFQKLEKLIAEYDDIFAVDSEDHGRTNKVYHRIDTGDARPIRQAPRRVPLAKQEEVSEMIEDMQRRGVIEESDSPWSSPVVLVRKKNGELRFCVDY
jgi:hypothetical protein